MFALPGWAEQVGADKRESIRPHFQQNYFVIDSFKDLLDRTLSTDSGPVYEELSEAPDIKIEAILPDDKVYTRGTQAYARGKAAA